MSISRTTDRKRHHTAFIYFCAVLACCACICCCSVRPVRACSARAIAEALLCTCGADELADGAGDAGGGLGVGLVVAGGTSDAAIRHCRERLNLHQTSILLGTVKAEHFELPVSHQTRGRQYTFCWLLWTSSVTSVESTNHHRLPVGSISRL